MQLHFTGKESKSVKLCRVSSLVYVQVTGRAEVPNVFLFNRSTLFKLAHGQFVPESSLHDLP